MSSDARLYFDGGLTDPITNVTEFSLCRRKVAPTQREGKLILNFAKFSKKKKPNEIEKNIGYILSIFVNVMNNLYFE